MSSTRNKLTKEEFVRKITDELKDIYEKMNELRNKSMEVSLTEADLEEAFDNLYDAKDLLVFYTKNMKVDERDGDKFTRAEWQWVRDYMHDLVEYGVGNTAELRREVNYNMKSKTGAVVGEGDEIRVTFVPADKQNQGVMLRNWVEIDDIFWLRDHNRDYRDYQDYQDYRDYDDDGY